MQKTIAPKTSPRIAFACLFAVALLGAFFIWRSNVEEPRVSPTCPDITRYSYFSTADVFDAGYKAAIRQKPALRVKGILVPHHLLAAPLIAEAFETIATKREVPVVLVSPDHFSAGKAPIVTTAAAWHTPYGQLASDCDAVERLARSGAVVVDDVPFKKEHGVSGLVPFVKKSLPNARIVPLLVKDTATDVDLEKALTALHDVFGARMVIVASFDFSHEMTDTVAEFHDRKSLAIVETFDDAGARALDIDSVPGLRLSMRALERVGAVRFTRLSHTNSSRLMKRPDQSDVTSYLTGTFSIGKKHTNDDLTLLAFGDMMLARGVEAMLRRDGLSYPFEGVPRLFKGSDLVTANAEGVFFDAAEAQKPVAPDDLRFPFEPSLLPILRRLGFTHLGLANNHALNFGNEALVASRTLIRKEGIETFGDPTNTGEIAVTTDVRGRKVTQIGYHQFNGHGPEDVLARVAEAKKNGDFVAVYPHWGVEYQTKPTQAQAALAHRFIDAGADVVLGAHPHVVEPVEIYKGKAIFYSLGNFVFDQSFSKETSEGLAVGIADNAKETTYYLIPLDIQASRVSLKSYAERGIFLKKIGLDAETFTLKK